MIAVEKIAEEIADSIRAVYASGAIPSHALLVYKFTDVYERLVTFPSDDEHRQISDRVGALIRDR